jgi:hypothetical protein
VPQTLSTWQEVVIVAGPAIAAVSALASWAAVWQAGSLARQGSEPLLMVQKIIDKESNTLGAVITNAGGGPARGATVLLSHPPFRAEGHLGHGFIYPGEGRHVWTNIPATDAETDVMAFCRDRQSYSHFWTADENHRVLKTRFGRRPSHGHDLTTVFRDFYPKVDYKGLSPAQFAVTNDPS